MLHHSKIKAALLKDLELSERELLSGFQSSKISLSSQVKEKTQKGIRRVLIHQQWKKALVKTAEGLAVAAVFCLMAYAVYIAAHETKEPIVAATGETETTTETETATENETKPETETETKVNPNHIKALDFQEKKILEELQLKKQENDTVYKEFISALLQQTTESTLDVWYRFNTTNALNQDILFKPFYGPTSRKIVFSVLLEAIRNEDWDFSAWIIQEMDGKIKIPIVIRDLNPATGKIEEIRYDYDFFQQYYKLKANSFFQRAANLLVKEKYPSSGYREYLRLLKSDYRRMIDPYIVDGITVTMDNFEDLFLEKNLEYQKDPDFWKKLRIGDLVFLGRYEQDNNLKNGAEPILWEVMEWSPDGKLYLQSCAAMRYMVWTEGDCEKDPTQVYWENSLIRTWLNGDFYEGAFSAEEKALIQTAKLNNDWHSRYDDVGGLGGNDTEDRVFVYSMRETLCEGALITYHYSVSNQLNSEYAIATAPPLEENQSLNPNDTWYRQTGIQKIYNDYFHSPRGVRAAVLIQVPNA